MKKIAYLYLFLFFAMVMSCLANAQCPPGTWSLDVTINPDQYPEETSFYVMNFYGDTLFQGGPYDNIVDYQPQYISACAPIDSFIIVIDDLYGDGVAGSLWGGNDGSIYVEQCGDTIWELQDANFGYQIFDTIYTSGCPPPPPVFGCMDSSYVEFDMSATLDTGMCFTPRVYGCTDSLAYNYIDSANTDIAIDSCIHELELTDLAGNGWAGSTIKLSQATSMIPPLKYQDIGTYTLLDGFDTTFFVNLAAGYPVRVIFEITAQSDFTAVQCGYSLYSEDYVAIDIEGGFVNPIPPFFPIMGEPYCGNNCIERTYGCIDSLAVNYNDTVNTDDGTCFYNPGCTNPLYLEYNASYDYDDGSCATMVVYGCMDSTALNYDSLANVELPNSCIAIVEGCTDSTMYNYNINANVDNGSCIPFYYGCTDVTAFNYDSLANTDDGSCIPVVWGCTDGAAFNYNSLANSDDGSCIAVIFGCTDPTMFNYCDTCNTDNGSCIPYIYGCMDTIAINYDAIANTDNGTCIYPFPGCMDATAVNFEPLANIPDSTCYYESSCDAGVPYYIPNACFEWVISVDPYCCDNVWDQPCNDLYVYCQDGWTGPTNINMFERLGIHVYPNPANHTIYFTKFVNVQAYNSKGALVGEYNNVNSLYFESGIYYLLIDYDKIRITKTIIILD